jgi:tetratricopeptide (TPR) repeat protein
MRYSRYTWSFAGAVIVLTLAALASFRAISALALGAPTDVKLSWPGDTLAAAAAAASAAPSYAQLAALDEAWRRENARQYTLSELRARGDGRRTPRQALQDRVYAHARRGDREAAIRELERWVASHRDDGDALLWLARLLNEAGRKNESVRRYRQALALEGWR